MRFRASTPRERKRLREEARVDAVLAAVGALHSRLLEDRDIRSLRDAEFKVFSQWGEDGIIQHLVRTLDIVEGSFVEIGVADYRESNTRFLLINNNWRGAIVDAGDAHVRYVTESGLTWRHQVSPMTAFVTAENINDLLRRSGLMQTMDLFSLDIDGNDYWVLKAADLSSSKIVIAEYNSLFGDRLAVTVPYSPGFRREAAHPSLLYYGASLAALARVLEDKGYVLLDSNSAGNNAFFVRSDLASAFPKKSVTEAFTASRFREARGPGGKLVYPADHEESLRLMADERLIDLETGETVRISDLYGLR